MLIRDRPLTALFAAVCRAHVWRGGTSALTFVRSLSQCFSILLYSLSVLLNPLALTLERLQLCALTLLKRDRTLLLLLRNVTWLGSGLGLGL